MMMNEGANDSKSNPAMASQTQRSRQHQIECNLQHVEPNNWWLEPPTASVGERAPTKVNEREPTSHSPTLMMWVFKQGAQVDDGGPNWVYLPIEWVSKEGKNRKREGRK